MKTLVNPSPCAARAGSLLLVASLAPSALVACGDADPGSGDINTDVVAYDAADAATEVSVDSSANDAAADATDDADPDAVSSDARPIGGDRPATSSYVARTFVFEPERADGSVEGFNLDNTVSRTADGTGCGQSDFVSPSGALGIDNQLALLLPLVAAAGGSALPALVQSAINEGDLLILLQFDGLDDPRNDDDVSVTIGRAMGTTIIGADSLLLPWQTFDVDTEEPSTTITGARIVDGVMLAGPTTLELPIFVFDFRFDVTLRDALIRAEFDEFGPVRATIGGAVTLENILVIANNPGIQDRIPALIEDIGRRMADMSVAEPGACDALSAAVSLELSPIYLYDAAP